MPSEITGGESLMRRIRSIPIRMRPLIEQAVIVGAGMIETQAKQNIRDNGSVVTGNLFQSVGTVMKVTEDEVTARVGTAVAYAPGYEFGMAFDDESIQSPSFPAAILDWVHIKGIDFGEGEEATAYEIVNHIREYGTMPHPFLVPAYQQYQGQIKELLERTIAAGMKDVP